MKGLGAAPRGVPSRRARAEGALIALAAGDALGWPQESSRRRLDGQARSSTTRFEDWERRSGGRFFAHREPIRAGEYSDDTQLTLAVARCRIHGGTHWWTCFTRHELPLWTLYERGGGGATKRAARCWAKNVLPWRQRNTKDVERYFKAGGNGVAMRVIPHAVHCADHSVPEGMLQDVVRDGAATHGHPRALVGAAAYAYAAWWLLRARSTLEFGEIVSVLLNDVSLWGAFPSGSSSSGWEHEAWSEIGKYDEAWGRTVDEMCHLLVQVGHGLSAGSLADDTQVLDALGAFGPWKGAGTVSAAAALYLTARYAANPTEGVVRAAFANGSDTDTIAAMTGGLLGMLAGDEWIPPDWRLVQDVDYLRRVADELASPQKAYPLPELSSPVGTRELNDLTQELLHGSRSTLGLRRLRGATVTQDRRLEPLSRTTVVHAWELKTGDGQTLYVTKLSRRPKPKSSPMTREEGRIKEVTAWLETDDAKSRPTRVRRLDDLLDILPMPSDGLSFLGGEASETCFGEVRRCYLDGSYMAVVLLCLAYVERELAAALYAAGWEAAKKARLRDILEKAHEDGVLSEREWRTYEELAHLRNSHAHFRAPGNPESMMARTVEENALPREVLAKDAKRAIQAMARIVGRQSGKRVTLDPPSF